MLGLGSLVSLLGQRFRRAVTVGGAVLVAVMGLSMLSQGAALAGMLPAAAQPGVQAQAEAGVQVVAYSCRVTPEEMVIDREIPVIL